MPTPTSRTRRLAMGLGGLSTALGAGQLAAPDAVTRLIGLEPGPTTRAAMRAVGAREAAVGAGLLTTSATQPLLWARVVGDVAHLGMLGAAWRTAKDHRRLAGALAAVAGVGVLDVIAAVTARRASPSEISASTTVTVHCSPEDTYRYWRDLKHLPEFMTHVRSVEQQAGRGHSHWTVDGPAGTTIEWDAEVVEDRPGELLAWRAVEQADVPNSGVVRFRPVSGGHGTEVSVELEYSPPAGALGAAVARLFGENPEQQIKDDLRRFKQVMEAGEVTRSDGTPTGVGTPQVAAQRPAAPLSRQEAQELFSR